MSEVFLNLLPAGVLFFGENFFHESEFQKVRFYSGSEGLGFVLIVIEDEPFDFFISHEWNHLFSDPVHVSIGTLVLKGRLNTLRIFLSCAFDVFEIYAKNIVTYAEEMLEIFVNSSISAGV